MHEKFMKEAIKEALKAEKSGDVPVGTVLVKDNKIIARSPNRQMTANNPAGHAEMIVLERTSSILKN
ncbi:MAG: deaminase [Nitrososphaerota archaeon]